MQANALLKPSLGLGVTDTYSRVDPPSAAGVGDYGSNTLQAGLSGKYAAYNPGNRLTAEQAERGLEVAQADLVVAEQDLIVRLAQAYFDVLAAQDALGTARASKAGISEQLASAKRNFEVGTATITDTREAQARYDLATAAEIAADNDLRIKSVTLDTLVGRVGIAPKPLAVPVALPAVLPANVEPWVSQADEGHPLIRKARLGLDVASLETRKARAANGVTVDLNGTLGAQRMNSSVNYGSAPPPTPPMASAPRRAPRWGSRSISRSTPAAPSRAAWPRPWPWKSGRAMISTSPAAAWPKARAAPSSACSR